MIMEVSGTNGTVQFSVPLVPEQMSGDVSDFSAWLIRDELGDPILRCRFTANGVPHMVDIVGADWLIQTSGANNRDITVEGDCSFTELEE
jgi:hypothetical protein